MIEPASAANPLRNRMRTSGVLWGVVARGVVSGLAGTTAMTVSVAAEKAVRRSGDRLIDYDASEHVAIAAAAVLHVHPTTPAQRQVLFLLTHWGYGSAVAIAHELLRERWSERISAPAFYAACQAMAFALFPTLGGTPPPWRWRRDVLVTSLAQHALYAATVAETSQVLR